MVSRSGSRLFLAVQALLSTTISALTATWTASSSLGPSARSGACVATDSECVYLFGGYLEAEDGSRSVGNDLWKFEQGEWSLLEVEGERPGPRLCSAAVVVGESVLLFGGWDPESAGTGGSILEDNWSFEKGAWRLLGKMPDGPTSRHVAVPLGDRALIHTFRCKDSVLLFEAGRFTRQKTTGPCPVGLGLHTAATLDGGKRVAVFGGAGKSGEMSSDAFVLDTETFEWKCFKGGPTPRAGACSAALDESTLLIFGGAERGEGLVPKGDLWTLDCDSGEWSLLTADGDAPQPRNAAVLARIGRGAGETTFMLNGGWEPFVRTFDDTKILKVTKS